MTTLLLGVLLSIGLVALYFKLVKRSAGISDAELDVWMDWRQEWRRRQRQQEIEDKLREMGAVEMPMAGEKQHGNT